MDCRWQSARCRAPAQGGAGGRVHHGWVVRQSCEGPVAQWLEQGTHNPLVPGSSPGRPTISRPPPGAAPPARPLPVRALDLARRFRDPPGLDPPARINRSPSLSSGERAPSPSPSPSPSTACCIMARADSQGAGRCAPSQSSRPRAGNGFDLPADFRTSWESGKRLPPVKRGVHEEGAASAPPIYRDHFMTPCFERPICHRIHRLRGAIRPGTFAILCVTLSFALARNALADEHGFTRTDRRAAYCEVILQHSVSRSQITTDPVPTILMDDGPLTSMGRVLYTEIGSLSKVRRYMLRRESRLDPLLILVVQEAAHDDLDVFRDIENACDPNPCFNAAERNMGAIEECARKEYSCYRSHLHQTQAIVKRIKACDDPTWLHPHTPGP